MGPCRSSSALLQNSTCHIQHLQTRPLLSSLPSPQPLFQPPLPYCITKPGPPARPIELQTWQVMINTNTQQWGQHQPGSVGGGGLSGHTLRSGPAHSQPKPSSCLRVYSRVGLPKPLLGLLGPTWLLRVQASSCCRRENLTQSTERREM